MSQDRIRKVKKGEILLKEGDSSECLFFVQSGKFQSVVERGAKRYELGQFKTQQIIGDQWIFSATKSPCTYVALQESSVLEVPLSVLKTQFEQTHPALKLVLKGMNEELKTLRQSQKSEKMESDPTPMPAAQLARSLSLIHLTAKHLGKQDGILTNVDWGLLRQFLQKFFMEPSSRTKQWVILFKKMEIASCEIRTNEEGEEDFGLIQFQNLQFIEDFAEFYQHYYFKNPNHEMIHYDMIPAKAAQVFTELGEGLPVDHRKNTAVDMKLVLERFKALTNMEFKSSHFDHLERKGLFVKRQSFDDGRVLISFDHTEFKKVSAFWNVLAEIEEWNRTGAVNPNKVENIRAEATGGCAACADNQSSGAKFCPECGLKLAA